MQNWIILRLITGIGFIMLAACSCASAPVTPQNAYAGSFVTPNIIRGPLPQDVQIRTLGVKHVLNLMDADSILTNDPADIEYERETCGHLGVEFKNISMSNELMPTKASLIAASDFLYFCEINGQLCLVHCRWGHDRTGWVIAVYRIRFNHYTAQQAYEEAVAMGHNTHYDSFPFYWKRVLWEIELETRSRESAARADYRMKGGK